MALRSGEPEKVGRRRLTTGEAIGVCLTAGVALLTIAFVRGQTALFEFSLSHTGVAFIVTGVVGIGYEIWSDRARLQQQIDLIAALSRDTGEERFANDVKALFPVGALETADRGDLETVYSTLRENLTQLIASASLIRTDVNERTVLLQFVADLLGYASRAGATLAHRDSADRRFALPKSAVDLAASLLTAHIEALQDGDRCLVISDFRSWDSGALDPFLKSMTRVLETKKVVIRRVFARFAKDEMIARSRIREILHAHWWLAASTSRYELAVSSRGDFQHLAVFERVGDLPMCFTFDEGGENPALVVSRDDLTPKVNSCWTTGVQARVAPDDKRPTEVRFAAFCEEVTRKYPAFWEHYVNDDAVTALTGNRRGDGAGDED
jgi:hypothetical protein